MMVALLHSNGQLRTERDGDRKDVKNLLYSGRLLVMMKVNVHRSCKASIKSSPPTPNFFYRPDALSVTQPTVSKY